jgi:4-hydroxy-3-methylbut-2-enyl diphosphate reductase
VPTTRGAVDDIDEVPAGAPVMLSAHGSPPEVERAARARSSLVVNAVCPLVRKVHHEIKHRAGRGHLVVYAGHEGHDETVGALAVAPEASRLVQHPADVAALPVPAVSAGGDTPVAFLAPPPADLRELMRARGAEQLLDDDADVSASDVLAGLVAPPTH